MCRVEDLIDKSPLLRIKESIDRGDQKELVRLLEKSVLPHITNDKFISFTAWNFDVAGTIYSQAKPNEIVEGWKFLVNEGIPLIIYTNALYTTSLFSWLYYTSNENIEVNEETVISNLLEPESLELLRLCYWIGKCKQIITDKNSFETKFNEVRDSLRFQNETEFKEQLTIFGRIMKDLTIPLWKRELHANELVKELGPFRSNVSSFVPEFMLAALVQEAGFDIGFIATSTVTKTCDLLVKKSYKVEVKTFLDKSKEGRKIESSLAKEIECTLKRDKAVQDINDSLSKRAEIIFMFLTFSSLSVAFAKYTFEKNIRFPLSDALKKSISLAGQNRMQPVIEQIPVLIFVTWIDVINCDYKISCYMVPYPVKRKNNNEIEADSEKLTVKLGNC